MAKKLVFIENEQQTEVYLRNIKKFIGYKIITFSYLPEKILMENNIEFTSEDEYESDEIYKNNYNDSRKLTDKILKKLNIYYKEIDLISLFDRDLLFTIINLNKYQKLITRIIEKENPQEIALFKSEDKDHFDRELTNAIVKSLYNGEISINDYSWKKPNIEKFHSFLGYIQTIVSRYKFFSLNKKNNKIYFSGQRVLFENIIDKLMENKNNKIFRFYSNLQKSFFINGKYIPFYYVKGETIGEEKNLYDKINLLKNKILKSSFSEELKIPPAIKSSLNDYISKFMLDEMMHICKIINELENMCINKKINLIMLDNDIRRFEKIVVRVCKKYKIPSIVLQHGIACHPVGIIPIESDYIIAYGENTKKWLIKNGTEKEKIIVLGSPRYEKYKKEVTDKSEKVILYAPPSIHSHSIIPDKFLTKKKQKIMHRAVINSLKNFPDYKLIIKTRDEDAADLPEKIAKEINYKNFELIHGTEAREIINRSEIVIVHESTLGLESLLLGKKVISFSFKELDETNPYLNSIAVPVVYNQKDLTNKIAFLKDNPLDQKINQEFLKKSFVDLNKESTKKTTDFINNLLKNK
ncbi:MAG: hypothetical protein WC867_07200 [Candidatus Pacearchaeota archaeon]|jgi:hypothetical protein